MKLLLFAVCFFAQVFSDCPVIKPLAGLNTTEFIRASWYVQQQQVNGYQNETDLNCVLATYTSDHNWCPLCSGTIIGVHNYQNVGGININPEGPQVSLCARQPDSKTTGELLVAPCFLPNLAAGPYWVIAVGQDTNGHYTWAVVSGGSPTQQYDDGCTTKETGVNGSGLWIFTREPTGNSIYLASARQQLVDLGYTLQRLKDVTQAGCKYDGALIKDGSSDREFFVQ